MSRVAVVIASKGRPADLALWLGHIRSQTLQPAMMIWCLSGPEDLPDLSAVPEGDRPLVVWSAPGLCRQRNAGLAALPDDIDIVAFFDDDYVPASTCLAGMARVFAEDPALAGVTGLVLADGINTRGIAVEQALALVAEHDRGPPVEHIWLRRRVGLYGCNMAFRVSLIGDERFDEQLPLYGWQEDVDFGARVSRHGLVCATNAFAGVHRGAKGGRTSGVRLGYSQVANILYLCRKRSMGWGFGLRLLGRNLLANHARLLWAEPWVDRRGRTRGNWLALADLARGRLHPRRVVEL